MELGVLPQENLVDFLFRLQPHQPLQILLADHVDHHQDLAQEDAGLMLHLHRLHQLLLGEIPMADEKLAEVFARRVGGGGDHAAGLEEDPLLHGFAGDHERPGLLPQAEPLQQVARLHRSKIATYAHDRGMKNYIGSC